VRISHLLLLFQTQHTASTLKIHNVTFIVSQNRLPLISDVTTDLIWNC